MLKGKFNCVVDSAWGSSGKGAVSTRLVAIHNVENASACNYPNAGHTVVDGNKKFVAKVFPSAAILQKWKNLNESGNDFGNTNPDIWIGPNSGFSMEQFMKEAIESELAHNQVHIHERAMMVEQRHIDAESPSGDQSTEHVSSTMSGSGAAFTEKAMRKKEVRITRDHLACHFMTESPMQFVRGVRNRLQLKQTFMHEVSQGFALSINHGTHYPYCTFRDSTPQQAYADFGIIPELIGDVYLNVRSFPIRVGNNYREGKQTGYSGDCLKDQIELTWEQIGKDAEMPGNEIALLAEKERTTVTKKIRRCFTQSWQLLKDSAYFCGATKLVLNFPQYIHWSSFKERGGQDKFKQLHPKVIAFVDKMEETTNLPVIMIGTGPDHRDYIYRG